MTANAENEDVYPVPLLAGDPKTVTGMAHVVLTLNDWKRTSDFYRLVLSFLGLTCVADSDRGIGETLFFYVLHFSFPWFLSQLRWNLKSKAKNVRVKQT